MIMSKILPASAEACVIVDNYINSLTKSMKKAIDGENLDLAHNYMLRLDTALAFKELRCKK